MSKGCIIDVKPNGEIEVKPQGYSGPECLKATREIERDLGEVESRDKTADYRKEPEKQAREVQA